MLRGAIPGSFAHWHQQRTIDEDEGSADKCQLANLTQSEKWENKSPSALLKNHM